MKNDDKNVCEGEIEQFLNSLRPKIAVETIKKFLSESDIKDISPVEMSKYRTFFDWLERNYFLVPQDHVTRIFELASMSYFINELQQKFIGYNEFYKSKGYIQALYDIFGKRQLNKNKKNENMHPDELKLDNDVYVVCTFPMREGKMTAYTHVKEFGYVPRGSYYKGDSYIIYTDHDGNVTNCEVGLDKTYPMPVTHIQFYSNITEEAYNEKMQFVKEYISDVLQRKIADN